MILFELHFRVESQNRAAFEAAYDEVFAVALSRQKGFRSSKLLRSYAPEVVAEIQASPTEHDY